MKKIFYIVLILLFANIVYADDFTVHKLNNGQTVIVKEIHDNPIVNIDTWIRTGSINEDDKTTGIAHFLEHLFFKGTKNHPTGEYDKILESKGAITNAATSKDFTHYYITIPSKDFHTALNLHADMLLNPLIPRKEMEKERKVVLEEITKSNDDYNTKLYRNLIKILYKEHPYKRDVLGTKDVIETVTRDEILNYYEKFYAPSNMVTVIVGDVDTQDAVDEVQKLFTQNKLDKPVKIQYKKEKPLLKTVKKVEKADVQTGYMIIGFRGVDSKNKKDSYALDVLATVLGDGKTSRLFQTVKERHQLAYVISAGHSSLKDDSLFFVKANFVPENQQKLEDDIVNEIKKLQATLVDKEELDKAKSIIERDTYFSRESVPNISQEMGYTSVVWGDMKMYKEYIPNIKKVTAKELQRVAKEYLNVDKMAISVLIPEKTVQIADKPADKQILDPKNVVQNKNISKYTLQNDATLLINHNTSNDIIAVEIYAKGGYAIEKLPATANLMAAAMLKGTQKYSAQDISQILEANGIELVPAATSDSFTISIKFTKNELPIVLDVLDEIVNNAKFDNFDIEKIKSEKLYKIKKSRDNQVTVAFDEYIAKVFEGLVYSHNSKVYEQYIPKIQRDDIVELYNKQFNAENLVISINGNVNDKDMTDYFTQIFKKSDNPKIVYKNMVKPFNPLAKNVFSKIKTTQEGATVVMGWKTDGLLNKKDYATLQIIDSILGSGMSSRLFTELRDEQGLAYQIGSMYSPKIQAGTFALYITTNPNNLPKIKKEFLNQMDRFKKEFVSDKELSEAKEKLLGNYILSFETNREKAVTLGWFEASERGFEFDKEYQTLLNSVTASDIIGVANKYFDKPYVYIVVSPK